MSAFSKLKSNRAASTAKLTEMVKNGGKTSYEEDKRYWQPEVDKKTGLGQATIRFLPEPTGEDFPTVTLYEHAFQRQGGWYIEKSRTTLGKGTPDPVVEMNDKLWNSGNPADRSLVSGDDTKNIKGSKRKQYFIANILVLKHDARPEDEGQVFLFKYGFKIKEKADKLLTPEFDDIEPVNVYDFWEGADFRMRITRQGKHRNYDNSAFAPPSPLYGGDDDKLEAVFNRQYSLKAEISEDKFKSYDDLAKRLAKVMGTVGQRAEARGDRADAPEQESRGNREATRREAPSSRFNDDTDDDAFFRGVQGDDDDIPF